MIYKLLKVTLQLDKKHKRYMKLGFFYTVHNEKRAVEYSISKTRDFYMEEPIFLVSEGIDFGYLKLSYSNLETSVVADTMSDTFKITDKNFRERKHQIAIKRAILELVSRLESCISYCKSEYIVMMDPDSLIRGPLNIKENAKLLGSRVNHGLPHELRLFLERNKAKVIDSWGATPAIFECNSFNEAIKRFREIDLDELCSLFYAMYAHDVFLPILYALIGEEEIYNPDIIECQRDSNWRMKPNPLVHQFREYY